MRAGGGFFSVSTRLPPPPPPSHPNASQGWFFHRFRRLYHHHLLPRIQTRAGGGSFIGFDVPATTTTSLASKCELEVVLSSVSTRLPPPPPPSHPNASWKWILLDLLMRLPLPPPPSHPNVSRGWKFMVFRRVCCHSIPDITHKPAATSSPTTLTTTHMSNDNRITTKGWLEDGRRTSGEGWDELEEGRDVREKEGRGMMTTRSLLPGVLIDNIGKVCCQQGCYPVRLSVPLQGPFLSIVCYVIIVIVIKSLPIINS